MSTQNQLYDALSMAVSLLMAHEPGDSRMVSDEVVTLAAIAGHCDNDQCHEIVQRFLAKMEAGEGPKPHAPGPDIVVVHVSDDFKRQYGIPVVDSGAQLFAKMREHMHEILGPKYGDAALGLYSADLDEEQTKEMDAYFKQFGEKVETVVHDATDILYALGIGYGVDMCPEKASDVPGTFRNDETEAAYLSQREAFLKRFLHEQDTSAPTQEDMDMVRHATQVMATVATSATVWGEGGWPLCNGARTGRISVKGKWPHSEVSRSTFVPGLPQIEEDKS